MGDHEYPGEATEIAATCTSAVRKFERFSSMGHSSAVIGEGAFSLDVRSSFVMKQAVFLLCVCMHDAYLLQPLIRAGSNPSKENINVLQWTF